MSYGREIFSFSGSLMKRKKEPLLLSCWTEVSAAFSVWLLLLPKVGLVSTLAFSEKEQTVVKEVLFPKGLNTEENNNSRDTLPSGSVWRSHAKVMITTQNIASSEFLYLGFKHHFYCLMAGCSQECSNYFTFWKITGWFLSFCTNLICCKLCDLSPTYTSYIFYWSFVWQNKQCFGWLTEN